MKALIIDAYKCEVRAVELSENANVRLAHLRAIVGGYIDLAFVWPNENVLFVDGDGMRHARAGFRLAGRPDQPLCGNGVVVGRKVEAVPPGTFTNEDVAITADELRSQIEFVEFADF